MMSGSVLAPWAFQPEPMANAKILANALGCFSFYPVELLECMQNKRMPDIVREGLEENISQLFG